MGCLNLIRKQTMRGFKQTVQKQI